MSKPLGMLEPGNSYLHDAGDRCTRACDFCAVQRQNLLPWKKMNRSALPSGAPDEVEACRNHCRRARRSQRCGADHFARTIAAIREMDPSIIVEVLVPDFHAQDWCIQIVPMPARTFTITTWKRSNA